MSILIIAAREINPLIGGIERVSYTLTQQWIHCGYNVCWLALEKSRWTSLKDKELVSQYYLPNSQHVQSDENITFVLDLIDEYNIDFIINQATIRDDAIRLCSAIKKIRTLKLFSVIHFAPRTEHDIAKNNLFLFKDDKSFNNIVKKLVEFFYFCFVNSKKIKQKEYRTLACLCETSDRVVVLSEGFISGFKRIYNSDKYQAISNPVIAESHPISVKKKQVLYVARIEYGMKRFDRMLDIWAEAGRRFPDWELIVVGDGDYLPHFKVLAKKRELHNISFVGFQNPEPYYASASILCLTSTTEGFGMVLIEAMQYGCVPIAYNSYAALSDIIEDGVSGYAITPFDKNEYIAKLSLLISDAEMRQKMAEKCIEVPKRFSGDFIASKWIELFEKMKS